MDAEGFGATTDDVDALIRERFPTSQWPEVRRLLDPIESTRTQAAVVINSSGDWASLLENVDLAHLDYRDVLVRAFYSDR